MTTAKRKLPPPIITLFYLGGLLFALGHIALFVSDISSERVRGILNMDSEKGIATWFSAIQFFCIAATGMLYTRYQVQRNNPHSWLLLALPAGFLFFSIDEIIQLHEGIGGVLDILLPGRCRTNTIFKETGIWMFALGIPFLLLFLYWIYAIRSYFVGKKVAFFKIVGGMLIFLFGALFCEGLSNFVEKRSVGLFLAILFEETLELLGSTTIFWGVYDLAKPWFPTFPPKKPSDVESH
jgi:hypothetical protein